MCVFQATLMPYKIPFKTWCRGQHVQKCSPKLHQLLHFLSRWKTRKASICWKVHGSLRFDSCLCFLQTKSHPQELKRTVCQVNFLQIRAKQFRTLWGSTWGRGVAFCCLFINNSCDCGLQVWARWSASKLGGREVKKRNGRGILIFYSLHGSISITLMHSQVFETRVRKFQLSSLIWRLFYTWVGCK